jgi:hypothetical protein
MVRFTFWNAGLLCAALGLTLAPAAQAAGPMPPPAYQAMARDILKELIETNSIHANGSTVAAQRVAKLALVAGFAPGDVTVLAPPERPTKGNVVIRLHGKGLGKPLLIIGHLDVVEANPRDWTTDPFKLIEKDGYYYGRGTEDMKGDDALILTALIRMKKEGFVPDRDIIAAFTADEEGGGEEPGVQWLFDKHRDLVESGLALNVDGDGAVWKNGVPYYVGVETSEKLYATYELETTNKGGHSSLPRADNAIYQLTTGLQKLAAYRFPLRLTDTTRSYFRELGRLQKGETGADMLALAGPAPEAAAGRLSGGRERPAVARPRHGSMPDHAWRDPRGDPGHIGVGARGSGHPCHRRRADRSQPGDGPDRRCPGPLPPAGRSVLAAPAGDPGHVAGRFGLGLCAAGRRAELCLRRDPVRHRRLPRPWPRRAGEHRRLRPGRGVRLLDVEGVFGAVRGGAAYAELSCAILALGG